jgi:membrane protein DedA with SNARE-associated domain
MDRADEAGARPGALEERNPPAAKADGASSADAAAAFGPAAPAKPAEAEPDAAADAVKPAAAAEEAPWWSQPGFPWAHKPTKADLWCWTLIAVVGVYAIALLPLRPLLIGLSPPLAAVVTGGRTSVVATGAWVHVFGGPLVLWWFLAGLSLVKFSWVYWWAGHLWGDGILSLLAGKTARSRRRADRAIRLTRRFWPLAAALTFLPVPLPMPIVFAAIGAAHVSLRRFLLPILASSWVFQAGYLLLGWQLGDKAVAVVDLYARAMWYVTAAVLIGMIAVWWWRRRQGKTDSAEAGR